ncbi:MAG TPA: M1 family aminopeptidase [Polyangiaceae bacterium]|nr:M1 family aminopeptidase [Polyangiaceae bacterium]
MKRTSWFALALAVQLVACGDDDDGPPGGGQGQGGGGGMGAGGRAGSAQGGAGAGPGGQGGGGQPAGAGGQAGTGGQAGGAGQAGAGGQGGATTPYDVVRYDLSGKYDWEAGRLRASVAVTFRPEGAGAAAIELDVNRNALEVKQVRAGAAALPFAVTAPGDDGDARLRVDVSSLGLGAGAEGAIVVEYEATPWVSLSAVPVRKGDPATGRVLYTASEPLGVAEWMPCHNDPADRAIFSAEFEVPEGETLVANGSVVSDEAIEGGGRRIKYATAYTLPTYLMAFAAGGLVAERSQVGRLPLAVWHRPGVRGEYEAVLDELERLVPLFEGLVGVPYPFEKYELVLLPAFRFGGIEHAGITFQQEQLSTNPYATTVDLLVTAHELAHQWFGDLVTVKTWDDLWVKEGMATFLEHEGTRLYLDESGAGLLNGDLWSPAHGFAIRDVTLPPRSKYNPGPYDRAAWFIAQLRSLSGESAFWGALKGVLEGHAFGAVSTDEFLEAFRPGLGEANFARARAAVDARALFGVRVEPPAAGAGPRLRVDDPQGSLVAPLHVAWQRGDGTVDELELSPGRPIELAKGGPDDFLVLDPGDRHPRLPFSRYAYVEGTPGEEFDDTEAYLEQVAPLRRPSAAQLDRFTSLAGAHQVPVFDEGPLPPVAPGALVGFLEALDSPLAEAGALARACDEAGGDTASWSPPLSDALVNRPNYRGIYAQNLDACAAAVDVGALFAADWAALAADPNAPSVHEARLDFLAKLVRGLAPADALAVWGGVATQAGSVRTRAIGARALEGYVTGGLVPEASYGAYRAWAAGAIAASSLPDVLFSLLDVVMRVRAETAAENAEARAAVVEALKAESLGYIAFHGTCAAYLLSAGDDAIWQAVVNDLLAAPLPDETRYAIEAISQSPDTCDYLVSNDSTPSTHRADPGALRGALPRASERKGAAGAAFERKGAAGATFERKGAAGAAFERKGAAGAAFGGRRAGVAGRR